ncbi:MAG: tetratricopeptide repeat protein [Saprospiraceae bacterium]|nr:tetratricopeptide repeat protein [Saprospiraceae bacterium]
MQPSYSFIFLFLIVFACSSEQAAQEEQISQLEELYTINKADSVINQLLYQYYTYVNTFHDPQKNATYLYRAAEVHLELGNSEKAVQDLEQILSKFSVTGKTEEALLLAAIIYDDSLQYKTRAKKLFINYLYRYPDGEGTARAEFFFLPEDQKMQIEIERLNAKLDDPQQPRQTDIVVGEAMLAKYAEYVVKFKQKENTAIFCDRGSKLAATMDEPMIAVEFLTQIKDNYPNYNAYPKMLFELACYYEELPKFRRRAKRNRKTAGILSKKEIRKILKSDHELEARQLHEYLIRNFAKHPIAQRSREHLKNIGKEDSEVILSFILQKDSTL